MWNMKARDIGGTGWGPWLTDYLLFLGGLAVLLAIGVLVDLMALRSAVSLWSAVAVAWLLNRVLFRIIWLVSGRSRRE